MALKNLFDMAKADRYTQDGREALIKAQEEETEDKVYQIGEISQKTGLQKTANGWVKPKSGKQPGAKKQEKEALKTFNKMTGSNKSDFESVKSEYNKALEKNTGKPAAESKPDTAKEIAEHREAAQYYKRKARSFSETDPSYGTYMKKAEEYENKAKELEGSKPALSQTDGKGNKVEIKITESKGGGFYVDKYVNGKMVGINNANTKESAEAKAKSMMEQHMADPDYRAESKPAADFTKYKRDTGLNLYGKSAQEGEQYMKENGFELQPESRPDRKIYKNGFGEKYEVSYTPEGVYNGGSHSYAPIPGRDNHRAYQEGMGNKYLGQKKREDGTVTQVYLTPEGKYERSDFTAKGEYNGGSTSSEEFYKKWYNDDLEDAAPRILTGDTRIRVRKA